MDWEVLASGYAAVWASENTREALWDAMQRRETYATTGTRMVVRFFGGWEFQAKDAQDRMPASIGYSKGVPMGGDLRTSPCRESRRRFSPPRSGIRWVRISIASRSSRAGSTPRGSCTRKSTTSPGRRPQARRGREASFGRHHGGCRQCHLDQHHRLLRAHHGMDRSRLRSRRACLLLRPGHRDSDAPMDGVRREALWQYAGSGTRMTITERAYTSPIWYMPN